MALLQASRRHAERPALWAGGNRLTYRQLFGQAAGWAMALRASGVPQADRIGILSHRTMTAYTGIVAALLAGCTYVPLNTRFPIERNRRILDAGDVAALIVDSRSAADLPALLGDTVDRPLLLMPETRVTPPLHGRRILTETDLAPVPLEEFEIADGSDPYSPAYLLFTSGTTGTPKGVPINHVNAMAYLSTVGRLLPLGPSDRVLQSADLTFDQSVHDMFLAWLAGAELYVAPENASIMAPRLIAEHGLTACHFVPSVAARARERGLLEAGGMPSLRHTAFGGEALPVPIIREWAAAAPHSAIYNFYGPTEGTVYFSCYLVDRDRLPDFAVAPVGRPLDGQRIALFDSDRGEVPAGETGEICLAGPQLMAGYWRAPELDAERFVEIDGVRWYKTGDLGRLQDPHGFLFAGRVDRQVKIRGYRVELQEIEGTLRRLAQREQVAVIAWPADPDGIADSCIAFVVGPDTGSADALRLACRAALPPYMVPSRLFFVDELPLNANGKVDHKALYEHAVQRLQSA